MEEVIPMLGLSCHAQSFLECAPQENDRPVVVVGVTGHRRLSAADGLRRRVLEILQCIRQATPQHPQSKLVALSALAEGADRLVAELLLSNAIHGSLRVVLPLELADYRSDFQAEGSTKAFHALLDQAEEICFPPARQVVGKQRGQRAPGHAPDESSPSADRNEAYERAGQYVVDHCDVLVALWDGEPAHGRGGTGDIVTYARQAGRPIVWINTLGAFETTWES
jgi:hypothetical protein